MLNVDTDLDQEMSKYTRMWKLGKYRDHSPAEHLLQKYPHLFVDESVAVVNDYGCGTGRALPELRRLFPNAEINQIDITENSRDEGFEADNFYQACLWQLDDLPHCDFGVCVDVIEHIPTHRVDDVLFNLAGGCDRLFLQGSMVKDNCGTLIGETLHLTVKNWDWWDCKISQYFNPIVEPSVNDSTFKGLWVPK